MSIALDVSVPAVPTATFPVHRFSVEEYHELVRREILTADDRVELLEGLVLEKMPINPPHMAAIGLAEEALRALLPPGWYVRVQGPITLPDSEPEPDLAVAKGGPRDFAQRHPGAGDIGLLLEVADSSLPRDRDKCRIYARSGIPAYWIVNLVDGCLETYSQPTGAARAPEYLRREVLLSDDVAKLILESGECGAIAVADLLPR